MTALKPTESLRVKGVAANRYKPNDVCAHPECAEKATDNHHCFPRSLIGNASWFVILEDGLTETTPEKGGGYRQAIPHVAGLCRPHHEEVELHGAWIKYEEEVFVWYDRAPNENPNKPDHCDSGASCDAGRPSGNSIPYGCPGYSPNAPSDCQTCPYADPNGYPGYDIVGNRGLWVLLGPLDPQPGDRTKQRKPKPKSLEPKRKSETWSIRVPKDSEDGIEVLKTLTAEAGQELAPAMGWSDNPPPYFVLCAVLAFFLQNYKAEAA